MSPAKPPSRRTCGVAGNLCLASDLVGQASSLPSSVGQASSLPGYRESIDGSIVCGPGPFMDDPGRLEACLTEESKLPYDMHPGRLEACPTEVHRARGRYDPLVSAAYLGHISPGQPLRPSAGAG